MLLLQLFQNRKKNRSCLTPAWLYICSYLSPDKTRKVFLKMNLRPIFLLRFSCIQVDQLSYDSNTSDKREQNNWIPGKNWTGTKKWINKYLVGQFGSYLLGVSLVFIKAFSQISVAAQFFYCNRVVLATIYYRVTANRLLYDGKLRKKIGQEGYDGNLSNTLY